MSSASISKEGREEAKKVAVLLILLSACHSASGGPLSPSFPCTVLPGGYSKENGAEQRRRTNARKDEKGANPKANACQVVV